MKKELRELLNIESIMSIVVVMIIFVGLGLMIGTQTDEASKPPTFGVLNYDEDGKYSETAMEVINGIYISDEVREKHLIKILPDGETREVGTDLISIMQERGLKSTIIIDNQFSTDIEKSKKGEIRAYYITEGAGMIGSMDSEIVAAIVNHINKKISTELIDLEATSEPSFLVNPVSFGGHDTNFTYINGNIVADVTPMQISNTMMTQTLMVPLVIMIVIMVVGSIVISSMGNEKENKTLETLLTLPVKRSTIVSSKILASAIMGLVYGIAYMAGMYVYMQSLSQGSRGINLADYGLTLGPLEWAIIMLVVFVAIMCALGLCMILGAFVKNYKSAQTMTLPITVLAIIPMVIFMFASWSSLGTGMQTLMFIIPFSHPMMIMQNLMFGNYLIVIAGIIYNIAFAMVTVLITVRLYNSDILLIGFGSTKLGRALAKYKKAN